MLLLFAGSILVVLNARGCWGHLVRLQASPHLTGRSGLGDACLAPSPCHPGHAYIPPPAAVVLLRATVRTYRGTSNIVFTNGALDPWSVFGVTADVSDSVVAVLIPDGAHHLDLMYATPQDSEDLKAARQTIMAHVARWVQQAAAAHGDDGGGLRRQAAEVVQQQ